MVEKNINIAIDDFRLKGISEVLGNKTCLKILDLLAEKNASVSDIAEELKMPLNTADYNVKKLVKAGLIESESHWWSVKGKKIPVYRVSNKKIVISPKKVGKKFLAGIVTAGLMGVAALVIKGFSEVSYKAAVPTNEVFDMAVEESVQSLAAERVADTAGAGVGFVATASMPAWQWFLVGAWVGVVLFFIIAFVMDKMKVESKIHHSLNSKNSMKGGRK